MSLRQISQRVGLHHSTLSRNVNKHRLTNDVKDRPRSEMSCITSRREGNALGRIVRHNLFANSTVLQRLVVPSVAICKNSPKSSEICWLSFKKTCKKMSTNTNTKMFPFAMVPSTSSMEFGLVVYWSDESCFLLHVTDDRMCVWRQPNTAERNIVETVPFGGGSVMVWDVYHMTVSLTSLQ